MASGLLALLDDVAALVKASAVSVDDVAAQVSKTSAKVSGIVIDDAAVTPKYVVGLDPKRELIIIFNIARASLKNKLLILGPAALVLGYLAPFLIAPILMIGGAYLCFEGYEKVHHWFVPAHSHDDAADAIDAAALEAMRTEGAIRTDMILSAEIMAIAYAQVAAQPFVSQAGVLALVAIVITLAVYGFVGLVVKADDIGLHLAKHARHEWLRAFGRSLVRAMPGFLTLLSIVGTLAMLWVGAEIIAHGIPMLHHALDDYVRILAPLGMLAWLIKALSLALFGIIVGKLAAWLVKIGAPLIRRARRT